jgi:hypothetical protein
MNLEQISALAQRGATNAEIEAALRRPMTEDEKQAFNRAKLAARIRRAQKPPSAADRMAAMEARRAEVPVRVCADPARVADLEADPARWLRHYLPEAYFRPFDRPHTEIIDGVMRAHETGGRFAVAAERGRGKSVLLWGLILYLKLTGRQMFPVCLPWAEGPKKRAFAFWKIALCFNDRLAEDYPRYCDPFRHAKGVSQRMMSQTWQDTGESVGARLQIIDGLIIFASGLGAIGGSTINGNPRGLNLPQEDGSVLRPTLALIDDPQDKKTANSKMLVEEAISKIDGDVAGIGDAGRDLPMLIAGNCIRTEDVMAHYLQAEGWVGLRVPCIVRWPRGWEDPKSAARVCWAEWWDTFRGDEAEGLAYYAAHREEMVADMELSAPNSYAIAEKTPDACYAVMRKYHKMGHEAFWSEQQQSPLARESDVGPYELRASHVVKRTDPARSAGVVPDGVASVVAAVDLNPSYGFTWAVVGFAPDQTAAVLAYGVYRDAPLPVPGDTPAVERARRVYDALAGLVRRLAGLSCKAELVGIDASGADFDAVLRFAAESVKVAGLPAVGMTGRGWKAYRPYGKSVLGVPREKCHMATDQGRPPRKWLVFQADYWREVAQKAWLGEAGGPGTASLPTGVHIEFAEQVAREQLQGRQEIAGQMVWVWHTQPGPHDYGDCMTMAYALAAWGGIGTGGKVQAVPRRVRLERTRAPRRQSSVTMDGM